MKSVCLNMIVKNESKVIERCLASVREYIDTWVIVDTGSTDGTQEIIRNALKDIPGELHERPWFDFAANRNEAMELAKGKSDYLLFIDADEVFILGRDSFPWLDLDCYFAVNRLEHSESLRLILAKQGLPWNWKGVLHEEIHCPRVGGGKQLEGALIDSTAKDSRRSLDPTTLEKDIWIMEKALSEEPNNTRLLFHIAGAYEAACRDKEAQECYEKRTRLGGFEHEINYCLLRSAVLKAKLKWPTAMVVESFLKAYYPQPTRAEALVYFADYMIKRKNYVMGYLLAKSALTLNYPESIYRVEFNVYKWGRLVQLAECAWRIGRHGETYEAMQKLLVIKDLPEETRAAMQKNSQIKIFDSYRYGFSYATGGAS